MHKEAEQHKCPDEDEPLPCISVSHWRADLFDWSYLRVNVSEEPEPLEGKKATALANMVQSMKVEFLRCIMHTDKVFSLQVVPLANMDAILQYTLDIPVADRAMEGVAQEFACPAPGFVCGSEAPCTY